MLYIILFGLLFLFACSDERVNVWLFRASFLSILLLTCFRSPSLGIDTADGYFKYFQYIQDGLTLRWVEPFWILLNKLAIWMGLGYQGVLIFSGIISLIPVYYVINKTCVNKCFALSIYYGLYFVLFSFNLVRQNIAISVALLAMYFYFEKKTYLAIACIFVGFMFHHSILLVLFLPLFVKIKVGLGKTIILLIVSFFWGLLIRDQFFFYVAGSYAGNLLSDDGYSGFRTSIVVPAIFTIVFNIFFVTILFSHLKNFSKNPWYLVVLAGVIMTNLTLRLGQGTRVVLYFSVAQAIFFPNYIRTIDDKNDKFIISILYVCFIGVNFIRMLISQWDTVCPYSFFWQ